MGSMYLVPPRKPGRPSDAAQRIREAYAALIAEGVEHPYVREIAERAQLSTVATSNHLNRDPELKDIWGAAQIAASHARRAHEVNPRRRGVGNPNQAKEGYPNLVAARAARMRRLDAQRRAREEAEQTA